MLNRKKLFICLVNTSNLNSIYYIFHPQGTRASVSLAKGKDCAKVSLEMAMFTVVGSGGLRSLGISRLHNMYQRRRTGKNPLGIPSLLQLNVFFLNVARGSFYCAC